MGARSSVVFTLPVKQLAAYMATIVLVAIHCLIASCLAVSRRRLLASTCLVNRISSAFAQFPRISSRLLLERVAPFLLEACYRVSGQLYNLPADIFFTVQSTQTKSFGFPVFDLALRPK